MAKKTITITLLNGEKWETECEIVGDLALHRRRKEPEVWGITHVPTQFHIHKAIPNDILGNKKKLLAWMAKVQESDDFKKDWMLMRKVTPDEIRTDPLRTQHIRKRILDHCLKTKV